MFTLFKIWGSFFVKAHCLHIELPNLRNNKGDLFLNILSIQVPPRCIEKVDLKVCQKIHKVVVFLDQFVRSIILDHPHYCFVSNRL